MQKTIAYTALKALKFLAIFIVVDLLFGTLAKQLYFGQETGKQARITHSIKDTESDIVIFGSSHANRHYVPGVFEETLGKSCYNAGVQGQGILFHDALQKIILQRTEPELVVLNIDDIWLYENKGNYDRLSDFYPYYWDYRDILKPVLDLNTKLTDVKMMFKAYQYNSTLVHALRYMLAPQKDFDGYLPLKGVIKGPAPKEDHADDDPYQPPPLDPNFIAAYKSFIATSKAHKTKLLLVLSPWHEKNDLSGNPSMALLREIAKSEDVPLLDLYNDPRFVDHDELFNDRSHLNDEGARRFSKIVAEYIKTMAWEKNSLP